MPKRPRMLRPKAEVLATHSLVPPKNLINPPPNQFTHELRENQPFYFEPSETQTEPDGEWAAGTQVVLLRYEGGSNCRVVDAQGLYVETAYAGLKLLKA